MRNFLLLLTLFINILKFSNLKQARCFMIPDKDNTISGDVAFSQEDERSPVQIKLKVYGAKSIHGFHIHEKGNIDEGCLAAGAHYNPLNKNHGGPDSEERHMGDLGNIMTKDGNSIVYSFINDKISLYGEYSIVGRSCVVHAKQDDLGVNLDDSESLKTGNSGARLACGIVQSYNPLYSILFGLSILTIGIGLSVYYFLVYKKNNPTISSGLIENEVRNS